MDELWTALKGSSQLSALEMGARLLLAFLLTSAIAALYSRTYRGYGRPGQMGMVLILVALATCGIIMAIGDNLALSLGMVGALSIVRFRAAVKDNRDLAYLFWTLAVGLVCGAGGYLLAGLLLSVIGAVMLFLERRQLFDSVTHKYIVVLSLLRGEAGAPAATLLPEGARLKASIFDRETGVEESTFLVDFPDAGSVESFKREASAREDLTAYQILGPEDAILG